MRKMALIALFITLPFASSAIGAEKTRKPAQETTQVQDVPLEHERAEAIRAIDEFGKSMKAVDPDFERKEEWIVNAIPTVARMFPPSQWESQIRFLYAALTDVGKRAKDNDPNAILGNYFADEERRAPDNIFTMPLADRAAIFERRYNELEQALASNSISLTEHAARTLAAALTYFPNDQRLVGLRRYKLELVTRLNRSEIDRSTFDAMWAIKRREYNDNSAQQRMMAEAQQKTETAQAWGGILSGAARGMQSAVRSTPQAPVSCSTIANVTTCR